MKAFALLSLSMAAFAAAVPTFNKDVQPLLANRCQGCHRAPREQSDIGDQHDEPSETARSVHVGSPPVSLRINRMHLCPRSMLSPYIIGQAPAITLISC